MTSPENGSLGDPAKKTDKATISKWVAFLLDDLITLPGTEKRIGLDPILGLIPGFGDFATSSVGLTLLAAGAKKRVPKSVYLRMIVNWALNALIVFASIGAVAWWGARLIWPAN